jgi:rhodanese-related sulfurtransferase
MSTTTTAITADALAARIGTPFAPQLFDVCRPEAHAESTRVIAGSRWRPHMQTNQWGEMLDPNAEVVVCCVHGHNVSQIAAAKLRSHGVKARFLEGGTEGFLAAGGPSVLRKAWPHDLEDQPSRWVTRERPKIDRLACPWFIRRFLDPDAQILYVEAEWVKDIADELGAEPFDIDDVTFGHKGELCSFDTFLDHFGVDDESLHLIARIIRGADTARLDLEPQCAGLLALALGISALHDDDHAALEHGMALYDSLYAWARHARTETHNWPPQGAPS